jgi:hypothetical protein
MMHRVCPPPHWAGCKRPVSTATLVKDERTELALQEDEAGK